MMWADLPARRLSFEFSKSELQEMKFVIAGCGIGGLTAAHALSRLGHFVVLLEKAPELKPVGAGISLQPNAMQALKRIGLSDTVKSVAWEADFARVLSDTGKQYSSFNFSDYSEKLGFLPMTIYRGDLIRVLHEALDTKNTEIHLNEGVESFEHVNPSDQKSNDLAQRLSGNSQTTHSMIVTTSRGRKIECDAIVGADGIHSQVRNQMFGPSKLNYAGYTCWRGMVTDPQLVNRVDTMTEVWGRAARFGFMKCNQNQVYWFATENRKTRTDDQADTQWKSRFKSWIEPIAELIDATPDENIVHNDIVDRKPIFPWGKGAITLLGDAAHAMTPNFGQGGAQAIEDAVVLGLAIEKSEEGVESAFRKYESFRHPRTSSLVKGSRQFGMVGQGGNWLFRLIRNYVMPNLPKSFVDKQLAIQCDFERYLEKFDPQ